jgi:hypothetical protein
MRARGENNVPLPKADEVVVYRSFMKARLRFPLDKLLVEVLKTLEIYLYQLTPEAIIKVGIFIWAMRIQGLEPDARCFCNIHELSYETKATGKEQYHNNFVVTVSCLGLRRVTQSLHFERGGQAPGYRNGFMCRM